MTSNTTSVGGVNVQVNVTNTIKFAGGGSAQIGNPTILNIGQPQGARIVLSNPPTISTGFGPIWISINGFNPNQFNISAGGFSLMPGNSNGRWNDHYNASQELWWRNRLVVMGTDANGNPNQWEYDWEQLGALLQPEPKRQHHRPRVHGQRQRLHFRSRHVADLDGVVQPVSLPDAQQPYHRTIPCRMISRPARLNGHKTHGQLQPNGHGTSIGINHLLPQYWPQNIAPQAYYQTAGAAAYCNGTGI